MIVNTHSSAFFPLQSLNLLGTGGSFIHLDGFLVVQYRYLEMMTREREQRVMAAAQKQAIAQLSPEQMHQLQSLPEVNLLQDSVICLVRNPPDGPPNPPSPPLLLPTFPIKNGKNLFGEKLYIKICHEIIYTWTQARAQLSSGENLIYHLLYRTSRGRQLQDSQSTY